MAEVKVSRPGYRSLFWPIILIGVGVIWLMGNLGIISGANIAVLFRLWPLILIVIGLDLLFGRQSPIIGALIAVGTVILIVGLMLAGPSLGLAPNLETVEESFSEPLGDATSARIDLNVGIGDATIRALTDSANLFDANIKHIGEVDFTVSGESEKTISLTQRGGQSFGPDFLGFGFGGGDQLFWNIGLSNSVPLNLRINNGVGRSQIDLSQLQIANLSINAGVGEVDLRLPRMAESYNASINAGAGELRITIADGAALNLSISAGVGEVRIDVPDTAAVQITRNGGLGGTNIPPNFTEVISGERPGDRSVWETAGFDSAERRIVISFDGGVGSLNIR